MRRILKGVVFMEEDMVVVVEEEGLEEGCPSITEAVEVIMEVLEGGPLEVVGALVVVDMEGEEGLEGVVGDMVEWEGQGISSSMEL